MLESPPTSVGKTKHPMVRWPQVARVALENEVKTMEDGDRREYGGCGKRRTREAKTSKETTPT